MAQTVKKGVVVFAATVAMVFGTMAVSGGYGRDGGRYAETAGSEIMNESFDVYGVRVVEINVESRLRIEFSDATAGRATLKTEKDSENARYTGRVNNGVLQINGSGYAYDNVLTLPSSVKEIRVTSPENWHPDLTLQSAEGMMNMSELMIQANQSADVSLSNMNIKKLSVSWSQAKQDNTSERLVLRNTKIGDFDLSMNSGEVVFSDAVSFERTDFKLGDSVSLSGLSARLIQKIVVSPFKTS